LFLNNSSSPASYYLRSVLKCSRVFSMSEVPFPMPKSSVAKPDPRGSVFKLAPGSRSGFRMRIRVRIQLLENLRQMPKFTVISEVFREKLNFPVSLSLCPYLPLTYKKVSSTKKKSKILHRCRRSPF
jgi:hypothetical protein